MVRMQHQQQRKAINYNSVEVFRERKKCAKDYLNVYIVVYIYIVDQTFLRRNEKCKLQELQRVQTRKRINI